MSIELYYNFKRLFAILYTIQICRTYFWTITHNTIKLCKCKIQISQNTHIANGMSLIIFIYPIYNRFF